jgi:hypothetical protein
VNNIIIQNYVRYIYGSTFRANSRVYECSDALTERWVSNESQQTPSMSTELHVPAKYMPNFLSSHDSVCCAPLSVSRLSRHEANVANSSKQSGARRRVAKCWQRSRRAQWSIEVDTRIHIFSLYSDIRCMAKRDGHNQISEDFVATRCRTGNCVSTCIVSG